MDLHDCTAQSHLYLQIKLIFTPPGFLYKSELQGIKSFKSPFLLCSVLHGVGCSYMAASPRGSCLYHSLLSSSNVWGTLPAASLGTSPHGNIVFSPLQV